MSITLRCMTSFGTLNAEFKTYEEMQKCSDKLSEYIPGPLIILSSVPRRKTRKSCPVQVQDNSNTFTERGTIMATKTFNIKLTDPDGSESTKKVIQGTTVGDLMRPGQVAVLNGDVVTEVSTTLRPNDHVELQPASSKAGC